MSVILKLDEGGAVMTLAALQTARLTLERHPPSDGVKADLRAIDDVVTDIRIQLLAPAPEPFDPSPAMDAASEGVREKAGGSQGDREILDIASERWGQR